MSTLTAPPNVAEQELTEEERQRKMWDYYEQEVLRGLNSGQSIPLPPDFWDEIREEVRQRLRTQQIVRVIHGARNYETIFNNE